MMWPSEASLRFDVAFIAGFVWGVTKDSNPYLAKKARRVLISMDPSGWKAITGSEDPEK